jgi:hypothetical protein
MKTLDLKLKMNVTFFDNGSVSIDGIHYGESTTQARFLKSRAFDQEREKYVKFEDERRTGMKVQAQELLGMAKEVMAWTRNDFPRTFYLPKDAPNLQQLPDGKDLDMEFWSYEDAKGNMYGVGFAGKANKPLWHYRFRDKNQMEMQIKKTIDERRSRADMMLKRKQERSQFQHTLKEGDILYSSWGYDQTNIDFYQVTAVGEKSVKIRQIASKTLSSDGSGSDKVVAVPNHFTGEPMTKIVRKGNVVSIASYANAYPWDGNPKHETSAGWGH